MKMLFLGLLAALGLPGPWAFADGDTQLLDAERITYDGVIVKIKNVEAYAYTGFVTFKVTKTGEAITLKYSPWVARLEGPEISDLDSLKPGMRVLIQRYQGSKGARYAKGEDGTRFPGRNQKDLDDYICTLKATSKPQPK